MPPRRRVSAPVTRVYESGPALHQARIPKPTTSTKKRIRSYGKKTTVRVPRPKDNTLTQMGFVMDNLPPDMSEDEDQAQDIAGGNGDEDENEDGEGDYEKAAKRRRTKRRRTMGDEPDRTPQFHTQTVTQVVRSFNSNYGTNDEDVDGADEEEEAVALKREKDIYDVPSSSPQITRKDSKPPPRRGRSAIHAKENLPPVASMQKDVVEELTLPVKLPARDMMPPPQTPHRARALEIPSSQSPATPLTLPSTQSVRTALRERAQNIPINFGRQQIPQSGSLLGDREDSPSSTNSRKPNLLPLFFNEACNVEEDSETEALELANTKERKPIDVPLFRNPNPRRNAEVSPAKVPKLEIKDTYDTTTATSQITRIPSSPVLAHSSPAKSVRFAMPDDIDEAGSPAPKAVSERAESYPPSTRLAKTEIMDSDAESEDEVLMVENEDEDEDLNDLNEAVQEAKKLKESLEDSCHGEVNIDVSGKERGDVSEVESQVEALNQHESEAPMEMREPSEIYSEANVRIPSSQTPAASPDLDLESYYGDIGAETQFQVDKLTSSSHVSVTQEEDTSQQNAADTYTEKTQYLETQRLATQYISNMPARTGESDVFVSMSGAELTTVLDRTRNHLIRNWKFAPKICRVWIYETQPVSAVQYMVEISHLKRPGDLPDEGLGNEGFNIRPVNTTYSAYEILQLYELLDPVSLSMLLEKGWFEGPPKKWERVAPAVIDELVGNLKPPLFSTQVEEEEESTPQSSETDTQEVDGQLLSNIQQFTQPASVFVPRVEMEDEIHSSPFKLPAPKIHALPMEEHALPPPSQATTVDLSQTQTPRRKRQRSVEIIMESPSRPTPIDFLSSTPLQLPSHRTPKSLRRSGNKKIKREERLLEEEEEEEEELHVDMDIEEEQQQEPESLVPYSMASSQLKVLTKSQLLSESLLQDSVPEPPDWVAESGDEDYDNDL